MEFGHAHETWFHPIARMTPYWLDDNVLVSYFVVFVLGTLAFLGTRSLHHKQLTRKQALLEMIANGMVNFVEGIMGPHSRRYVPLIGTLFIFILWLNLFGLLPGFISPTASLSTTIGLALCVFAYVQYEGIRSHGFKHYFMHFVGDPWWLGFLMLPLHVIGEFAKPLSLALRLAGNLFAEDSVILILAGLSPALYLFFRHQWAAEIPIFPVQFLILPLMIFFGLIQALVFSMLSAIYIAIMAGEGHEEAPHH
jgi:F-type H+-transporting ATPase subunit a